MPSISVIVPVYNVEKYLHRCVDSILNQSYSDFELILVDDGSPDNCGYICDTYAKADPRIHVIHQKNGGLSAARNAGIDWAISNSNSQWVTFIDSDDWVVPNYLELLFKCVNPSVDLVMGNFSYPTDSLPIILPASNVPPVKISSEEMYCTNYLISVTSCCKLIRKSLFENIRYPEGMVHEDLFITYKLLFHKSTIIFIDSPIYSYFQSQTSITRSPWNPKRLASIIAHEEAIFYFKNHHFPKAELRETEAYLKCLANSLWAIRMAENIPKEIVCQQSLITAKLKKTLLHYLLTVKREDRSISLKSDAFIFDISFPFLMKIRSKLLSYIK